MWTEFKGAPPASLLLPNTDKEINNSVLLTQVYVWHTRTENPKLEAEQALKKRGMRSDDGIEV
ncbi:hypothetical protein PR048_007439 [Dryococelus australis]|uniref:Uncharacterized protein n=1 Tax=Dryococelus australis TaxID=614101 RepID=A0ABQ9HU86_9NEOP|nr:hypothetical protein PR048_007439 [Dryococelus australis]